MPTFLLIFAPLECCLRTRFKECVQVHCVIGYKQTKQFSTILYVFFSDRLLFYNFFCNYHLTKTKLIKETAPTPVIRGDMSHSDVIHRRETMRR